MHTFLIILGVVGGIILAPQLLIFVCTSIHCKITYGHWKYWNEYNYYNMV
jgi:hypothetical protein